MQANLTDIRATARMAAAATDARNHTLAASLYRQIAATAADLQWSNVAREYADLARVSAGRAMGDSPHA